MKHLVKRRVILFFVAAALVVCAALGLTMLSAGGVTAHAAESHSTSHPGWTALTAAGGELTGGNYYLTGDTALETDLTITGTVKLCLNGYVLTGTGTSSVITVDGGALTLCDCNGTGRTNTVAGAEYAGGVLTGGAGTTIDGSYLYGGGIFVGDGSIFTLESGTIAGNTASYGGGVYAGEQTTLTINGGTVADNSASSGGGVFATNIFRMSGGAITNNTTDTPQGNYGSGGGVQTNGGSFTMTGGEISDNTAEDGGGVYLGGELEMSGSAVIQGNSADYAGGGVFVTNGASFVMKGGSVSENVANGDAGGVYVNFDASFAMEAGTISGNKGNVGGGIYAYAATVSLTGGMISENEAYFSGGGLYFAGDDYEGDNSYTLAVGGTARIENNVAGDGYGGGIAAYYYVNISIGGNALIRKNVAEDHGGGIALYEYCTLELAYGTISENTASGSGGGIYSYGDSDSSRNLVTMTDGTVAENDTESDGGGIYLRYTDFTMTNGVIEGNEAEATNGGGGVSLANDETSVMNLSGSPIIQGNTFDGAENNLFIRSGGAVNIVDSLIDARIGVNIYDHYAESRNWVGVFTSGYHDSNGRGNLLTYFSADNPAYTVTLTEEYEAQVTYGSYTVAAGRTDRRKYVGCHRTRDGA